MDRRRILRLWAYMRRGHASYFAFMISLINFLSIQILLNNLPLAILFVVLYVAACIAIGYWDYRRGLVPVETGLASKANPYARVIARALLHISRGEYEEAEEVLRRWLES